MADDLDPFIARERRREAVRAAHHRREMERQGGVAWAGLGPGRFSHRSPDALVRCAIAARDGLAAWRESRVGRLNAALVRVQAQARAIHATAQSAQAALARAPDAPCPVPLAELRASALALAAAVEATMDADRRPALSDGGCATNTASGNHSTGSPRSSAD